MIATAVLEMSEPDTSSWEVARSYPNGPVVVRKVTRKKKKKKRKGEGKREVKDIVSD